MRVLLCFMICFVIGAFLPLRSLFQPIAYLPATVFMGDLKVYEEWENKETAKREQEEVSRGAVRSITMEITAYSEHFESCGKYPGEKGYGITASGEYVRPGIVAADLEVLPLHSLIFVEGIGKLEVKDSGGVIKGNKLDLYLPSHESAIQFGRKTRRVTIIRLGGG